MELLAWFGTNSRRRSALKAAGRLTDEKQKRQNYAAEAAVDWTQSKQAR